jgi:hypothetical protein
MDYPRFTDAVARFRRFLDEHGHRGPLCWLFPTDVLLVAGDWIIRPRRQETVIEEVAEAYHQAITRRLGVRFNVLCLEGDAVWCYVYCPTDRSEAEHCMMPDGLKLSVPISPHEGYRVANDEEWEHLQSRDMQEQKRWRFT